VSTSETIIDTPASKAQVLEELKARIRELEGSPHYKCFMCKVSKDFFSTQLMIYISFVNRKSVKHLLYQLYVDTIFVMIVG
jgi:hypothetical protein